MCIVKCMTARAVTEFDRVAKTCLPKVRSVEIILSADPETILDSMLFQFEDGAFTPEANDPDARAPGPELDSALRALGWDGTLYTDEALDVFEDGVHLGQPSGGRFANELLRQLWRAGEERGYWARRNNEYWDRVVNVEFDTATHSLSPGVVRPRGLRKPRAGRKSSGSKPE